MGDILPRPCHYHRMRILFAIIIFVFLSSNTGTSLERNGGTQCTLKAFRFCQSRLECQRNLCLNKNKNPKEPKKKTKKVKFCRKVVCSCVCPLHHEPVCDAQGTQYNNKECALCAGVLPANLQACPQAGPHPPLF